MWGNFTKLAERAANAAEAIEAQMNDSVGAPVPTTTSKASTSNNSNNKSLGTYKEEEYDDDDDYDTTFDDDDGRIMNTNSNSTTNTNDYMFDNRTTNEKIPPINSSTNSFKSGAKLEIATSSVLKLPPINSSVKEETPTVVKLPPSPINNDTSISTSSESIIVDESHFEAKEEDLTVQNEVALENTVIEKVEIEKEEEEVIIHNETSDAWAEAEEMEDMVLEEEEEEEICFDDTEQIIEPPKEPSQNQQHVAKEENKVSTHTESQDTATSEVLVSNIENEEVIQNLQSQILSLQTQVTHQETQLTSQATALSTLSDQNYAEKSQLEHQITNIKEEAKKRISRAKDRVNDIASSLESKDNVINELRSEGEKLSTAKGTIEQLCRQAKNEVRELQTELQDVKEEKVTLSSKLTSSKTEADQLKKELTEAKKSIDKCTNLEHTVHMLKEENTTHLHQKQTLENQIQQLKFSLQEYQQEVTHGEALKQIASSKEMESLAKQMEELRSDLERKLRLQEREANVREDALRDEMEELRKRWQDAVRRADMLSMDVQNATAPLVRQLESTERSMRVRASTWAELEQKLRSDLEHKIVEHDQLVHARNEVNSKVLVLTRKLEDGQSQYNAKVTDQEDTYKSKEQLFEQSLHNLKEQCESYQQTIEELQHSILQYEKNSSVMKEYILQKDTIQELTLQVKSEEAKRMDLENQLDELVQQSHSYSNQTYYERSSQDLVENKDVSTLQNATDQVDILKLLVQEDGEDEEENTPNNNPMHQQQPVGEKSSSSNSSFAAMEQLSQNLSNALTEIATLRAQLTSSEAIRTKLTSDYVVAQSAHEKLPLFELKVLELTNDLVGREQETKALHEDILDIKEMYRSQLDVLLEEKAAWLPKVDVVNIKEEEAERIGEDLEVNLAIAFNGDIVA